MTMRLVSVTSRLAFDRHRFVFATAEEPPAQIRMVLDWRSQLATLFGQK